MFFFRLNQCFPTPEMVTNRSQSWDYLYPLRKWLNCLEIRNELIAHLLCRLIPIQCPFERDIYLLGHKIIHIPPLCKFNPLYEEVIALRFRALCYLVDECGKDIRIYY